MKKILIISIAAFAYTNANAQELFVFTEPASNMAANSIGIRFSNALMKDEHTGTTDYYFTPELMAGISKQVMVHTQAFMSTREGEFNANGASLYTKYRFYSVDDVHKHFRIAAFGRYSFNNMAIHQPAIDLMSRNSGYEAGLIATQLINKVALSASVAGVHVIDNGQQKFLYANNKRNAVNYTFSVGKLMLPKEYINYSQTNVNLMAEFLGQVNTGTGQSFLDIAPSLQFIINSRIRIDAGYCFALVKNLYRSAQQSAVLKVEYNFYNVMK
jgi:hypothetical protein